MKESRRIDRGESGAVLIMAMFLVIFALGITVTGASIMKANKVRTATNFILPGQASQFARSGLVEAVNWLRRQSVQPVTVFAPVLDTTPTPQILDTLEPDIGLVREFRISGNVWGRYEVWKEWDSDPDSDRLARRKTMQCSDVSVDHGGGLSGSIWNLKCIGIVFVKRNSMVAYDQKPNRIIATEVLDMEVGRLSLTLPGQSAVCIQKGNSVNVLKNGCILGGADGAGVYYDSTTGIPNLGSDGIISGNPIFAPSVVYDDSVEAVFGVTETELRSMADFVITKSTDFPSPIQGKQLIFVDCGNIRFDKELPLKGSGILYIKGSATVDRATYSLFRGVMYVTGHLTVHAPVELEGSVICLGSMTVNGNTEYAQITYDDSAVSDMQALIGSYRTTRAIRRAHILD